MNKYPCLRVPGSVVYAAENPENPESFSIAVETATGELVRPFETEYFNFEDADRAARKFAEDNGE